VRKYLYYVVAAIGFLQIAGYMLHVKTLRGIGAVFCSSPLPIVFTEVRGVETFASDFSIMFKTKEGVQKEIKIDPSVYSKLKGPYNRRNIYGAAIAYGPVLDTAVWNSVLSYGLCRGALVSEMGIDTTGTDYSVRIKTRTAGRNEEWLLKPVCR
jgi:hypothetical protein